MNKDKIGIIGAMDHEIETLINNAKINKITKLVSMNFCEGSIGNKDVVIVKSGMGKVNAGICANTLINQFGCTKIINTGISGSLDNKINIGDLVISVDAVQHDFDVSFLNFKKGEIPFTGLYAFKADDIMRNIAKSAAKISAPEITVFEGRICSGDQFISTKEQKDEIIKNFGGLCCEMEGGAIAQVCYLNNIPFVILRIVSDSPNETEYIDYKAFEVEAANRCAKIVLESIKNM